LIKPEFKIDKRFKKRLQARYERFDLKAGILEDKPHKNPEPARKGLGALQGGPVRKQKAKTSTTLAKVSENLRKTQADYLRAPFEQPKSKPMIAFRRALGDLITRKNTNYSRVEAALRAVLRIPILQKKYGSNTPKTRKVKTFNRKLIDTGQFFKAIIAKVRSGKNV